MIIGSGVVLAADYTASRTGSIANCSVSASNKITENMRTASATTSITGAQYGTEASVSATIFYIKVSGNNIGATGTYRGGNSGQYGATYSYSVPNNEYRFYRIESSHLATYQGARFSVPNLVTVIQE